MLPPDEIQPRGDRARREHGEAFMPQAQLDEVDDARLVVNHDDSRELLVGRWHGWIGRRREQRRKRLGPPAPRDAADSSVGERRLHLPIMGAAFVGRQAELDALTALPRQARQARGGASAVVTGAPGSGKTRLLAEVSRRLGGLRFTRIVGYEPVLSVPLAAVGDLLRELGVLGPGPGADGKIGAGAARAA